MVRNCKIPALFAALALAATCAVSPAQAGLALKLQSGGQTYTKTGNIPVVTQNSMSSGVVIGNYTLEINTGVSTLTPSLDLSAFDLSTGAGTLTITLSETGFSKPIGAANWRTQFSGNFVTGSATVTEQTYLDNTNTLFGTGTLLGTLTTDAAPFGLSEVTSETATGPFALTEVLTIVATDTAQLSLDASIAYVPEPASLTLLASAMVGVCSLGRRKRHA